MRQKHTPHPRRQGVGGLWQITSPAHGRTSKRSVCRPAASFAAFKSGKDVVRQWIVEVVRNPTLTFKKTVDKRSLLPFESGQPRQRLACAGNHHVCPGRGQVDELGKLGLCLVDVYGLNGGIGCWHTRPPMT